ncbi:MAG: AlpA family phage regulatory protein [Thermoanaerobaculia bacterium]|nr:AlpA family phage regulatory protein [Thermoanaerobaculia bacterium]
MPRSASQPSPDAFLRPRAAAAHLGIGRSTVYRMVAAGLIPPPARISARAVGWKASTLDRAILDRNRSAARG